MNRPAVTQAKMRRAVKVLEAEGKPFGGFRLHPDGSVDVLTGMPEAASDPVAANEALELWRRSG